MPRRSRAGVACRSSMPELRFRDDVRIGFLHPFDGVNAGNHDIRQGSFIGHIDKYKNVRLTEAGVNLRDAGNAF